MRTGSEKFVDHKIVTWTHAYLRLDWKYIVARKSESVMLLKLDGQAIHYDEFQMVDCKKMTFCFVLTFSVQNSYKFREDIIRALEKYYSNALSRVLFSLRKGAARKPYNSFPNPPFTRALQMVEKVLKT